MESQYPRKSHSNVPPLHHEPRRIRPPFDAGGYDLSGDQRAEEPSNEWRERRQQERVAALTEALDGVELGDHDRRIVAWLAGWDVPTVGTVASLFYRAREAGGQQRPSEGVRRGTAVQHEH
ncbi:hypothetical protein [Amycolatopsis sp. lyj-84]|uniref:hypothetical protein n=1 Tax=Amycolatopsis sp. lyj-84 TaxID=2789284 RepID=UPI00397DEC51